MWNWHWLKLRLCLHSRSVSGWLLQRPTVSVVQLLWSYRRNCLYHEDWKSRIDRWGNLTRTLNRKKLKSYTWKLASGFFVLNENMIHDFSEMYDDYHIVCKSFLIKTDVNFIGLKLIFRGKKFEKNWTYHLTMVKARLTILPWYTHWLSVSINFSIL